MPEVTAPYVTPEAVAAAKKIVAAAKKPPAAKPVAHTPDVKKLPLNIAPEKELNRRGFTRRTAHGQLLPLPRRDTQTGGVPVAHPAINIPRNEVETLANGIEEKPVQ